MGNNYGAWRLDGSTQYGTASDNSKVDFGINDFAVDVAFTVAGGSGIRVLLSKWAANVGWRIQISSSGDLQLLFNSATYTASTTVNDGAWHHLHITVDRSVGLISIFVDGALDGTLSITSQGTVSNSASLYVGWDGSGSYWNGKVAEVRLSNRARHTSAYTVDVRQFTDDLWTKALYHFNEGITGVPTGYDMSTVRNHLTASGSPVYVEGPYEACPITIVREQVWLAIDSYANLTTFLSARKTLAEECKYRYRLGDRIPSQWIAENTPALVVTPVALPDIESETSAFHLITIPLEIQGHLHHKAIDEIEFFWWVVLAAVWSMYKATTTAGRFNFGRIQHMISRGPSFEVQEQEDSSLFSSFTDTLVFSVRHDFLE